MKHFELKKVLIGLIATAIISAMPTLAAYGQDAKQTEKTGRIYVDAGFTGFFIPDHSFFGGGAPQFWDGDKNGNAVDGSFVNWGGESTRQYNEPDNFTDSSISPNGQNAVAIAISDRPYGKAGEWNDIAETNRLYYVIEYDEVKE
jgi:hypothetical protein